KCGYRFTTFERIEETPLLVIKKNGAREEFNREKVLRGLIRSAEKRPVAMEQMEQIVDHVEQRIRELGVNEISSNQIGEYVMEDLKDVDEIALSALLVYIVSLKTCLFFLKNYKILLVKPMILMIAN